MLKLSEDLELPIDAVTQTFCILGKRGVGKSHLLSILVEEMLSQQLPLVICDVCGVFWGLRSSRNGKSKGYEIIIFGGEHGDVALEPGSGAMIADFIVSERIQCVLDLSMFTKQQLAVFMAEFSQRLYQKNRSPLHLVLDEADALAPQVPQRYQMPMLDALDEIVRRGRVRGIGVSMATQRPAVLNKNLLSQIEVLVALRLVSPNDLKAIDAWIGSHGTPKERETLMKSLSALPIGTAWFWSPGWLQIFQRTKIRQRKTFDSSATPKVGALVERPKSMAEIDIDSLTSQMKELMESREPGKSKVVLAGEPVAGEVKINARLQRELEGARNEIAALQSDNKMLRGQVKLLREIEAIVMRSTGGTSTSAPCDVTTRQSVPAGAISQSESTATKSKRINGSAIDRSVLDDDSVNLSRSEQRVLFAFYWLTDEEVTPVKVGFYSGYSRKSGSFNNTCSKLRRKKLVKDWGITELGMEVAERLNIQQRPTGIDKREWLRSRLSAAQNAILDAAIDHYPERLSLDDVASVTGYSCKSGSFNNALSGLRSLDAITGYVKDGGIVASEHLV